MRLCFNNFLFAFSFALDCVEKDYFHTASFHGKRVAYLSMLLGEYFQLDKNQMNDLIGCAILHDNGLTENYKYTDSVTENEFLKIHCVAGEENISYIPFFKNAQNIIKYHHEMANGEGPFGLMTSQIPLGSQIIHVTDYIDVNYHLHNMSEDEFNNMCDDLKKLKNIHFDEKIIDAFLQTITYPYIQQCQNDLNQLLNYNIHNIYHDFTQSEMLAICRLFARIIDNKSPHTKSHSIGVATKAAQMSLYYGYGEDLMLEMFFAGAMHDVGKLVIDRDVLEKPAKLTDQEYTYMQTHAYYTYKILNDMDLGDIVHWSSYHHEKLDGSGYPFGKVADELDFNDRLMACCDIYQALTENRPYKEALSHEKTIEIMRNMVKMNKIDGRIVEDMNKVFKDLK